MADKVSVAHCVVTELSLVYKFCFAFHSGWLINYPTLTKLTGAKSYRPLDRVQGF